MKISSIKMPRKSYLSIPLISGGITEPDLEKALDKAVAGPCFTAAELPPPKPEERKAPGSVDAKGALLDLMGVEDDDSDDGTDDDEE
jgi:hypothetical protein